MPGAIGHDEIGAAVAVESDLTPHAFVYATHGVASASAVVFLAPNAALPELLALPCAEST